MRFLGSKICGRRISPFSKYHLDYAASTFGSNHSAIGLVTNKTLDMQSPDYQWVDEGLVLESMRSGDFNAIDPNITFDENRQP